MATLANVNLSVPFLSEQFSAKPSVTTVAKFAAKPSAAAPPAQTYAEPDKVTEEVPGALTMRGSTNPNRPDSELGDLNRLFDPRMCRLCTDEEVGRVNSRVVVVHNNKQHILYCGAMECYSLDDLKNRDHSFENGSNLPCPQTNPFITETYPQGLDVFSNDVSVVRAGGNIFNQIFGKLRVHPAALVKFVLQHGECNAIRDGAFAMDHGQHRRIIMGCCGQSYTSESVEGHAVPKATYGLDIFDKITDAEERRSVKAMVASCLDAMQDMADYTETKLGNPLPYNDSQRYMRFGKAFADGVGAERSRLEDLSLQLKHIEEHERTFKHRDTRNCPLVGWTKTLGLSFTVMDADESMWSLKAVGNSRAAAGAWEGNVYQLTPILTRIRRQMDQLDHYLDGMMAVQRESGGHQYHERVTSRKIHNLVLDEHCPWEDVHLGSNVTGKRMRLPAAPVRDIHLSAPATIAYRHHQAVNDVKRTIEMVVVAGYHHGYDRYYDIGTKHMNELTDPNSRPSLAYYKLAKEQYGVPFGSAQVGRISPSAVNFEDVYLNDKGEMNEVMDDVVDGILKLLRGINDIVGTEEFHHNSIENLVQGCMSEWHQKGHTKLDLAEFRIMIIVQLCCLIKVGIEGHKDLHNLVYPVKSLGAAKQLEHVHPDNRQYVLHLILKETSLEEHGTNAAEGSLCETSEKRVGNIFDHVFQGQMIFRQGPKGKNLLKHYCSDTWMEF